MYNTTKELLNKIKKIDIEMTLSEKLNSPEINSFSNEKLTVVLARHSKHDKGFITPEGVTQSQQCAQDLLEHYKDFNGEIIVGFSNSPVVVTETGQNRTKNTALEVKKILEQDSRFKFIEMVQRKSIDHSIINDNGKVKLYEDYLQAHPDLNLAYGGNKEKVGDGVNLCRDAMTNEFPGLVEDEKFNAKTLLRRADRIVTGLLNIEKNNPSLFSQENTQYLLVLFSHDDLLSPFLTQHHGDTFKPAELLQNANPIFCKMVNGELDVQYQKRAA
jgi:hypothetical protein